MRIVSFIGSRKGLESNTFKIIHILVKALEKYIMVEHEVLMASELNLNYCRGCLACFQKGICPLDAKDGFYKIKKKLLQADLIIMGTPVYAASVSGDMKTFIDRLSYWLHLMPLIGKLSVSVVVSSTNSLYETNIYLKKMMESMGMCLTKSILCTVDGPRMLDSSVFRNETIPECAKEIYEYFSGDRIIKGSEYQDFYFKHLKNNYEYMDNIEHAETEFWKKSGYLEYTSFDELLCQVRNTKIST